MGNNSSTQHQDREDSSSNPDNPHSHPDTNHSNQYSPLHNPSPSPYISHYNDTFILSANDPEFDGFFERATDGTPTSPTADVLKEHYNIPNAFNIYIVDFVNTRDGTSGISLYPWDIDSNIPGAFFKHTQ